MSTTELRGAIHVLQGLLTEAVSVINTIEPESTEEKAMLDALVDRMCAAATPFCQQAQPADHQQAANSALREAMNRSGAIAKHTVPYGWVRMNAHFNSGVFHLGRTCPPGWVGGAEPVSLIVAPEKGGA